METYSNIPEAQWPPFVGDANVFTPEGQAQQVAMVNKLKRYKFDFIAVTPMWRTQNTVLPYLTATGHKGEIWSELKELYQNPIIVSPTLALSTAKILGGGRPIEIPKEEAPFFTIRKDGMNEFKLPAFPKDHSAYGAETGASKVVIQRVLDMIKERSGGTNKSILLVGYGSSGVGVFRMLTKDQLRDLPNITNTGVWMIEGKPDGQFKLRFLMMFRWEMLVYLGDYKEY